MDNIERLYKCYEILSEAGDKVSEVSAIKNSSNGRYFYVHTYTHTRTSLHRK